MTGRRSSAVEQALAAVQAGTKPRAAALAYGCHIRSIYRAMAALKEPATGPLSTEEGCLGTGDTGQAGTLGKTNPIATG